MTCNSLFMSPSSFFTTRIIILQGETVRTGNYFDNPDDDRHCSESSRSLLTCHSQNNIPFIIIGYATANIDFMIDEHILGSTAHLMNECENDLLITGVGLSTYNTFDHHEYAISLHPWLHKMRRPRVGDDVVVARPFC